MSPFRKVVKIINIRLKPIKKRIINCHGLKAVAIQVVDEPYTSPGFMSPLVSHIHLTYNEVIKRKI